MSSLDDVFVEITRRRLVPVVSEADTGSVACLADALVAGGLPVAEIALRAEGALEALRAVADRGDVIAIAGTVLSPHQVDQVADAGAKLVVSPGFDRAVVERCLRIGLPVCPGVATPTDVQAALSLGITRMKFFPAAAAGGTATLSALAGPFPQVRFMPTGGVSADSLNRYLALDCVFACGGGWMVSPNLYSDGRFDRVEAAARDAVRIAAEAK